MWAVTIGEHGTTMSLELAIRTYLVNFDYGSGIEFRLFTSNMLHLYVHTQSTFRRQVL